ncbi:hypothetical protein TWF225_004213 [Orbilia oligospora]|nr:hypothetical protein TWF225_004213 [Orbilia oligospora]
MEGMMTFRSIRTPVKVVHRVEALKRLVGIAQISSLSKQSTQRNCTTDKKLETYPYDCLGSEMTVLTHFSCHFLAPGA